MALNAANDSAIPGGRKRPPGGRHRVETAEGVTAWTPQVVHDALRMQPYRDKRHMTAVEQTANHIRREWLWAFWLVFAGECGFLIAATAEPARTQSVEVWAKIALVALVLCGIVSQAAWPWSMLRRPARWRQARALHASRGAAREMRQARALARYGLVSLELAAACLEARGMAGERRVAPWIGDRAAALGVLAGVFAVMRGVPGGLSAPWYLIAIVGLIVSVVMAAPVLARTEAGRVRHAQHVIGLAIAICKKDAELQKGS